MTGFIKAANARLRLGAIAIAALILTGVMLPSLSEALMAPVEQRFARVELQDDPGIAGFIVLGGDIDRIEEAAALGRKHPEARIVVTGHDPLPPGYFRARGVADDRLLVEPAATNTHENAVHTARLLGPKRSRRWILVTSAYHMPRAIGCFRKEGVAVEPWPVADRSADWRERLAKAAHEWAGLLAYWLEGRTDELFPSPEPAAATATAAVDRGAVRAAW